LKRFPSDQAVALFHQDKVGGDAIVAQLFVATAIVRGLNVSLYDDFVAEIEIPGSSRTQPVIP